MTNYTATIIRPGQFASLRIVKVLYTPVFHLIRDGLSYFGLTPQYDLLFHFLVLQKGSQVVDFL